jgi:hypothetical protein
MSHVPGGSQQPNWVRTRLDNKIRSGPNPVRLMTPSRDMRQREVAVGGMNGQVIVALQRQRWMLPRCLANASERHPVLNFISLFFFELIIILVKVINSSLSLKYSYNQVLLSLFLN